MKRQCGGITSSTLEREVTDEGKPEHYSFLVMYYTMRTPLYTSPCPRHRTLPDGDCSVDTKRLYNSQQHPGEGSDARRADEGEIRLHALKCGAAIAAAAAGSGRAGGRGRGIGDEGEGAALRGRHQEGVGGREDLDVGDLKVRVRVVDGGIDDVVDVARGCRAVAAARRFVDGRGAGPVADVSGHGPEGGRKIGLPVTAERNVEDELLCRKVLAGVARGGRPVRRGRSPRRGIDGIVGVGYGIRDIISLKWILQYEPEPQLRVIRTLQNQILEDQAG